MARLSGSGKIDQLALQVDAMLAKGAGGQAQEGGASVRRADALPTPLATPIMMPTALMLGATQVQSITSMAQPYTMALHAPVGVVPWGQELGQQMLFAVSGQQQLAILHLNPPQLGPLEVHLQLHDGQVNAQFVSPHQAVRQAVESAMPQLHDLFTGAGLSLMQTSVNSGGTGRHMPQHQLSNSRSAVDVDGSRALGLVAVVTAQAPNWKSGLVNTYV
jgi:flagellar hook-length control protein FliK